MSLADELSKVPFFEEFTPQELALLDRSFALKELGDGEILIREGDEVDPRYEAVYVLLAGKLLVTCDRPDEEGFGVVRMLDSGEVIGLVALLDPGPRSATCRAAGPVRAAALMRPAWDALCTQNPRLAGKFLHAVARQLARDMRGAMGELASRIER